VLFQVGDQLLIAMMGKGCQELLVGAVAFGMAALDVFGADAGGGESFVHNF